MAVGPKIAIAKILADLNLAVRYGIAICTCIYVSNKILADFNLAVAKMDRQTAKISGYTVNRSSRYHTDLQLDVRECYSSLHRLRVLNPNKGV